MIAAAVLTVSTSELGRLEAAPAQGARFLAGLVARSFFHGLLEGRVLVLAPLCADRVSFDGRWVAGRRAIDKELLALVGRAKARGVVLRKVTIFTLAEMKKRFGPPPARLKDALRPGDLLAVASFRHLGAIAALRRDGRTFRIHLLSD